MIKALLEYTIEALSVWWSIILIWAFTVFQSNLSDCGPFLSNLLFQAQLYDDKKCFSSSSPLKKNPQTIDDDKNEISCRTIIKG